jgi:hypothetical protein
LMLSSVRLIIIKYVINHISALISIHCYNLQCLRSQNHHKHKDIYFLLCRIYFGCAPYSNPRNTLYTNLYLSKTVQIQLFSLKKLKLAEDVKHKLSQNISNSTTLHQCHNTNQRFNMYPDYYIVTFNLMLSKILHF